MGGHHHRLARGPALTDDFRLQQRHLLIGQFGAQIAAGDHDAVRRGNDLIKMGDSLGAFNLGQDIDRHLPLLQVLLQLLNDRGGADKRKGDEINVMFNAEIDILPVLVVDGRQIGALAADIDMPPGGQNAVVETDAAHIGGGHLLDQQADHAAVNEDDVPQFHLIDKAVVTHLDTIRFKLRLPSDGQGQGGALAEHHVLFHIAGPHLRPLGVEQNGNSRGKFPVDPLEAVNHMLMPVQRAVRHIEPGDIHARVGQLFQHIEGSGLRTDGADNFCLAHTGYLEKLDIWFEDKEQRK